MSSSDSSDDEQKQKKVKQQKASEKEAKKEKKRVRESSSSSDDVVDKEPLRKKAATGVERIKDQDGNDMLELGSMKYAVVREFRGKQLIDLREYYMDKGSGQLRPGKKGISLNAAQFQNLKNLLPEIDAMIK